MTKTKGTLVVVSLALVLASCTEVVTPTAKVADPDRLNPRFLQVASTVTWDASDASWEKRGNKYWPVGWEVPDESVTEFNIWERPNGTGKVRAISSEDLSGVVVAFGEDLSVTLRRARPTFYTENLTAEQLANVIAPPETALGTRSDTPTTLTFIHRYRTGCTFNSRSGGYDCPPGPPAGEIMVSATNFNNIPGHLGRKVIVGFPDHMMQVDGTKYRVVMKYPEDVEFGPDSQQPEWGIAVYYKLLEEWGSECTMVIDPSPNAATGPVTDDEGTAVPDTTTPAGRMQITAVGTTPKIRTLYLASTPQTLLFDSVGQDYSLMEYVEFGYRSGLTITVDVSTTCR